MDTNLKKIVSDGFELWADCTLGARVAGIIAGWVLILVLRADVVASVSVWRWRLVLLHLAGRRLIAVLYADELLKLSLSRVYNYTLDSAFNKRQY